MVAHATRLEAFRYTGTVMLIDIVAHMSASLPITTVIDRNEKPDTPVPIPEVMPKILCRRCQYCPVISISPVHIISK